MDSALWIFRPSRKCGLLFLIIALLIFNHYSGLRWSRDTVHCQTLRSRLRLLGSCSRSSRKLLCASKPALALICSLPCSRSWGSWIRRASLPRRSSIFLWRRAKHSILSLYAGCRYWCPSARAGSYTLHGRNRRQTRSYYSQSFGQSPRCRSWDY